MRDHDSRLLQLDPSPRSMCHQVPDRAMQKHVEPLKPNQTTVPSPAPNP